MSVKESVIETLVQRGLIAWCIKLLERSRQQGADIHIFSLDFSSALLANILHSYTTLESLEKQPRLTKEIMNSLLGILKDAAVVPTSVLMHVLICLSYLSKERFTQILEDTHFVDKISDFVELYSQLNPQAAAPQQVQVPSNNGKSCDLNVIESEINSSALNPQQTAAQEIDKKTVLDLCAHMFHPKDQSHDVSGTMEYNEIKQEERIRELENAQGDLIFECF